MATEPINRPAIFPDIPRQAPIVDKDGHLDDLWALAFNQLFESLQRNYKDEGILIPPLTAANMTTIQNLYTSYIGGPYNTLALALPDISGQTVYDTDTKFTNQFVIAQDNSGNVTLAQWVPLSVMLTYPGDPNGHVPGVLNWLCYDTSDVKLYVCTTAGNAANAVWTALT